MYARDILRNNSLHLHKPVLPDAHPLVGQTVEYTTSFVVVNNHPSY